MVEHSYSLQEVEPVLAAHNQTQLLRFWDELSGDARQRLARQILDIDWHRLDNLIRNYVLQAPETNVPDDIQPAPYYALNPAGDEAATQYRQARKTGETLLQDGKVAGFTVAGGQGTRLGYDGPKGSFPISPVRGKSLFQLFAESLLRAREKYDTAIPWYIMTSPMNDRDTRDFFSENEYFGIPDDDIFFFPQGTMPAIGYDGKLLLKRKDSLALSPDGHGGSLLALSRSGALEDMRTRGIEHISYWQVDNPLVHTFDPLFLGLHAQTESDMSSRALMKTGPHEKLGNFCTVNGKLIVIEYSDIPDELAEARDDDGRLRFRAGSPAIHILRREFVEQINDGGIKLPVHRADKKVPHVDAGGNVIDPQEPNAVKLEMFIFDALPLAENPLILEADRREQFAPVKNRTGVDSAESSRRLMSERAARWLENAGITVPRTADGNVRCTIELSPRAYLDQDDVKNASDDLQPPRPEEKAYYS